MVTRKKIKLLKDGIQAIREWYLFVDKRTNVDTRISKKLNSDDKELDITQTEAQILMRWYMLVPTIAKDKIDETMYKVLEHFIKQQND